MYAGSHALERPPAPPAVQREANQLAGGPRRYVDEPTTDTRLYAVPVVSGGSRAGTVVVGLDLEPYERTASRAFLASLIFAAVVLVLMALTVRWVIGRALRPVAQMTADAEAWTEHDLDHRFGAGEPHDELTQLAATFDRMLARLAASLRREQRFSAELSHELRTPLSAIVAEVRARAPPRARRPMTIGAHSRRSPIAHVSWNAPWRPCSRPHAPSRSSDVAAQTPRASPSTRSSRAPRLRRQGGSMSS